MRAIRFVVAAFCLFAVVALHATIFGRVLGVVHDAQHRPIQGAHVTLKAQDSDWSQSQDSNDNGEFEFSSVPIGDYAVTVSAQNFQQMQQNVVVQSDTSPVLHFELTVAGVSASITVSENPVEATTESVTPTTMLNRVDIQETPGADRTNGLEMITDYVPAAYVTHDMLHIRGGHQYEWLIDGVPIPNTNIASNLAPQIDPKDIDYLEVQRGSYDADYGDRTYGIFNIVPRTGFERDTQCDFVASFGNFYQTNDQISCGGHSQRFAYYISLNGNRSDYGFRRRSRKFFTMRRTVTADSASLIFNPDAKNQIRVVASLRRDYYQIPLIRTPTPRKSDSGSGRGSPSYGLRTASMSATATSPSRGSTPSIQICCLRSLPFITTTAPTTKAEPTIFPSSPTPIRLPITEACRQRQRKLLEKRSSSRRLRIRPASVQLLR